MTVSSAAAGAESNAEGAVSIKYVTRSGSNAWHGGLFEQHRNGFFNANYYYNNLTRQPRDHIVFNQFGGMIGGPIKKNTLFIFAYFEAFRLPQAYTEPVGLVLTPEALQGFFRYRDSSGAARSVNLLQLAAANGFTGTPDPSIAKTLSQIAQLTSGNAGLQSRIASNSDYNRNNLNFQSKGANNRNFPTTRIDWNLTEKHHLEFVYNYQTNLRSPDGVNIGSASPVFPGTGIILNSNRIGSQGGIAFSAVAALRSTLTPRLTSEIRFGLTGGKTIFNDGVAPDAFAQWNGYAPAFGFGLQNPYRTTGQTRRNTPLKQGNVNMTWSRSVHVLNFGGSFTQVNTWNTAINGTQFVPVVNFGVATGDPVITGGTNIFNATNFPGANTTDAQTNAPALYALLTGRVSSINRSVVLDDQTRKYGMFPPVVRNQQRELGLYIQDSWRVRPGLTFNYGVRWDHQNAPVNLNGIYTRPGYDGLWGVSGVGALFAPGVLNGRAPVLNAVPAGTAGYEGNLQLSPSVGVAWVLPKTEFKPLAWLLGRGGQSVLRAGYAISTIREDASTFAVWGANQGRTVTLNVDPNANPADFGPAGSVLFRNPALPSRPAPATPSYPIAAAATNSIADFSPHLKVGYVQSWTIGFQRELSRDTVLEVRYIGNHGTDLWRNVNLNEVNIFENGFLSEFQTAQSNLALARAASSSSNQFAGLAGQKPLPIVQTALALNSDATTATQIVQGQAGALAQAIATNVTRMGNLTRAGYPLNLFQVNPTLTTGAATVLLNGGDTHYHGLQVETRRRLSAGLLLQGSYTWSHSISNEFSNGVAAGYTTLRNFSLDKGPSPYDIRHAVKLNWIYELPFGPKRRFLSHAGNAVARKALEGWEVASVTRLQTGSPLLFRSGRSTFNGGDSGVELHNLTLGDLQQMMAIRKTTNAQGVGVVYFLPQSIIDNSLAAFELGGKTLKDLDPSKPYVGPQTAPGALGTKLFLDGPPQRKWDFALVKKTSIGERFNVEFRAQALNAFNLTNFLLFAPGNNIPGAATIGTAFGQIPTNGAYRDLSNTNDTGGRIIEFALRLNF